MAGDQRARDALDRFAPKTHYALQNFVVSMTDVVKNDGKRTFFGKDKGIIAFESFCRCLRSSISAMLADGQITLNSSPEEIANKLETLMEVFRGGYPNWPEAYTYFTWSIRDNRHGFIDLIGAARRSI